MRTEMYRVSENVLPKLLLELFQVFKIDKV